MRRTRKWLLAVLAALLVASTCAIAACGDKTGNEVTLTYMVDQTEFHTVTGKPGDEIGAVELPVKTGYTFEAWQDGENQMFTATVLPERDTTLYALFAANPYTVTFHVNGGTGVTVSQNAVYDAAVTVPAQATAFTKKGYTLTGWALTADAEAADFALDDSLMNLTAEKDATVTLYAYYTVLPVDGDYVKNAGKVVAYIGHDEVVTLPDDCTAIGDGAFADNLTLREIVVPDTYTEIGFGAFEGCDNLEKLTVPFIGGGEEDTSFLAYVFGAATYRDNVFAYNLTEVGEGDATVDENSLTGSFYIPQSLRIVVINSEIDTIGEGAFYYAYGLEKVIAYRYTDDEDPSTDSVYSYRIKTVGDSAFEGCHRIGYDSKADVTYYMPWLAGVETFGNAAFKGYVAQNDYFTSKLRTVGTLSAVKTIGDEAFRYNSGLNDIELGENLLSIGKQAFASVNLLQRIVIPDSCVTIGDGAFEQCLYLGSVTIGSGVTSIGKDAFKTSAALTEVFIRGATLPTMAEGAFYGVDIGGEVSEMRNDVNPGFAFYFDTQAAATAAETTLKRQYPSAAVKKAGEERGPFYYVGNDYDFTLTFSAGHTMIICDPFYRIGFGLKNVVGTYEKMNDVLYDAEIYNLKVMLDIDFTIKLDYYLSKTQTHYYIHKIKTFTLKEVDETAVQFTVGKKQTDEWYLEENKYGQIGLWHNGAMVELDVEHGATYVVGGVSQMYDDRTIRTFAYKQGNAYFEPVVEYDFIYVPDPDTQDGMTNYYGKLYLDETAQKMLFGTYNSSDKNTAVFVDEQVKRIEIKQNDSTLVAGTYTTADTFGNHTLGTDEDGDPIKNYGDYTLTVATDDGSLTVRFTDFLESVTEGQNLRDIYARCRFTLNDTEYVLYNNKYSSYTDNYYVNNKGELSDDHYVLMQYEQRMEVGEGEEAYEYIVYPGFGEHYYTVGKKAYHDYLTYSYEEGETGGGQFVFKPENGTEYNGMVVDSFVGSFSATVPTTSVSRTYTPYFEEEEGETFTDGKISITLTGYGKAIYTDEDGNKIEGSYNVYSDTEVARVYTDVQSYYVLLEYIFRANDGETELYFVPVMYDAYDGSMTKGEMLRPDLTRNRTYRTYDRYSGICTGIFASSGYGMGIFYLMIDPETNRTVGIDNYFFAPGATYAYYDRIGGTDEKPLYRMTNGVQGFFTWSPTDTLTKGHNLNDISRQSAYDMEVGEEYDGWWKDPAALTITGKLKPSDEEYVLMPAREEIGDYTTPNGYTLTLDGQGHAVLKDASGTTVHEATYESLDEGVLSKTTYPLEYTVNGTKYTGTIDIEAHIIRLALTVGAHTLDNFVKIDADNPIENYTGSEYGTISLYGETYVGMYRIVEGKEQYKLGKYELDKKTGHYICRFDDVKLILTLSEDDHTYTVENSYRAIRLKEGTYYARVYYSAYTGKNEDGTPKKNAIYDADENEIPTVVLNYHNFQVLARKDTPTTPHVNDNSEYKGTWIDTQEDIYRYQKHSYDLDITVYEDGELTTTYVLLDIIPITNDGWYFPETEDSEAFFIIDRGNAIVEYVYDGIAVG